LSVSPPPNTFAPPLSVGRFCLWNHQTTRGKANFCVCHQFLHVPQFQPRLPVLIAVVFDGIGPTEFLMRSFLASMPIISSVLKKGAVCSAQIICANHT
jgi:hypothetical protein